MAQKVVEQIQAYGRSIAGPAGSEKVLWRPSSRFVEAIPGILSWVVVLAPIWLTIIDAQAGIMFVMAVTMYFALRVSSFGVRSLFNRGRILGASRRDWLAALEQLETHEWRQYRITLMIRAYREGNVKILRQTLDSIYASNWPREDGLLRNVEVVFATEEDDPITPPLVEQLEHEFAGRLAVRQIPHPNTPRHLPGPSSAMHHAGRVLYEQARAEGFPPHYWLVADFDCDTLFHPQYLPALAYHYATDDRRHRHAYQPVVLFTTDYWKAPLHSRLSAVGTSVLTLGWNRKPEIAFTGAAASLALLRSVNFWPTNSHSQDSGIELRLRLRYGADFRVVGLPVPLSVYPVMITGPQENRAERVRSYLQSFRTLFRQSARWREGPLDEFVESVAHRHGGLTLRKLLNGLERDTLTLLPAVGPVAVQLTILTQGGVGYGYVSLILGSILSAVLTIVSLLGVVAFGQVLVTREFIGAETSPWRKAVELPVFWLVFSIYVPVVTAVAGLKTSSAYVLGRRPRGHYLPTPK
ncbi:MAG: glycosyltransferase family A protein [Dehalococcoidales bacterium]|nr:glycosyltransferase family A protein [Dehalococcoidales bacterium]